MPRQINNFIITVEKILVDENMTLKDLAIQLNIRYATMWECVRGLRNIYARFGIVEKVIRAYPKYISIMFDLDKIPRQLKK